MIWLVLYLRRLFWQQCGAYTEVCQIRDVDSVVGKITCKDVHRLTHGIWEWVDLHGKRDCADVNKLRILRWEAYPGLSRLA